ncbi:Hypothetical predicted protein [Podarcis lilfordi]|uniref:Uncharacterized protein n=1 Tax=Podarcis lilfordi TaxID=74358 RepID=A0AA35KT82_9SAUR|nr:Hypothetical predicted protein [Podarcis lilfordi]
MTAAAAALCPFTQQALCKEGMRGGGEASWPGMKAAHRFCQNLPSPYNAAAAAAPPPHAGCCGRRPGGRAGNAQRQARDAGGSSSNEDGAAAGKDQRPARRRARVAPLKASSSSRARPAGASSRRSARWLAASPAAGGGSQAHNARALGAAAFGVGCSALPAQSLQAAASLARPEGAADPSPSQARRDGNSQMSRTW